MQDTTSEWIEVRGSKIHNKGIFATKDIPKGTRIIEYVGNKISKMESELIGNKELEMSKSNPEVIGSVYVFILDKKWDIDGNVSWNTARLINHSCSPNCEAEIKNGRIWILASRDIKKGEELSYDYEYDISDFQNHPCKCGSKNCVGYIVAKYQWIKLRKKLKILRRKARRKKKN